MIVSLSMDEYPEDFEPSEVLSELLIKGLESGLNRLTSQDELWPMLLIDTPEGIVLAAIEAETRDQMSLAASDCLVSHPDATAYALVFQGVLRTQSEELDIVIAEGAEIGMRYGYRLLAVFGADPDAVYHGHADQLLASG